MNPLPDHFISTDDPDRPPEVEVPVSGRPVEDLAPVAHKAASGVIWTIAQSLVGRASLLLGQLVLARILLPKDFGVVGLATTITNISSALVYFGIDQILQQRKHTGYLWATQVFWISLSLGIFGALVMITGGVIGSIVFHNQELIPLILIIALSTPLTVLATVPQAALQWQLKFGFLSAAAALESLSLQLLIVFFALIGFGPISFVIPFVIVAIVKGTVFWKVAKVKLRPLRRSRGWMLITRRGMSAMGNRISNIIINQGDFVILGLFAPTPVVGAYFFAFRLASQPMAVLGASVTNVLFSSLLKISDAERRARVAFSTSEFVGAVTVPVCFLLAATARPIILLLFGAKWTASIHLIQILSVGLPFDAISWPAAALLVAEGFFKRQFFYQTVSVPFFILSATIGAYFASATGLAIGVGVYYFLHPLWYTSATFRRTGVGVGSVALLFGQLFVAAMFSFGGVYWLSTVYVPENQLILQIVFVSIFGPICYVAALCVVAQRLSTTLSERALKAIKAGLERLGGNSPSQRSSVA